MATVYKNDDEVPFTHKKHIGQGAMGVVDEVAPGRPGDVDGQTNTRYARKMIKLSKNHRTRDKDVEAIKDEVEALRAARHQHTVRLVASYLLLPQSRRNQPYFAIVMDPRAEQNLENCLTNPEELGEARGHLLDWIRCLVNAIAFVHSRGIRHRDIKPENILVSGLNILLTDFGISSMGVGKTRPTTKLGRDSARTAAYCSPDIDAGHTRGRSGDIFSLGAVFLEMLAADRGELDTLREQISDEATRNQSFASHIVRAIEFLDTLDEMMAAAGETAQSTVLALCRAMLRIDRSRRPVAGDMCSWLARKGCFAGLQRPCSCANILIDGGTAQDASGDTSEALRRAYRSGHRLTAKLLLDEGAVLSAQDALTAAAEGGLLEVVQGLVRGGADPTSGRALRAACAATQVEVAGFLLGSGADPDSAEDSWTGLHDAARRGDVDVVDLLLKNGATVDAPDANGLAAAHYAVVNGHNTISEKLLDAEAAKAAL